MGEIKRILVPVDGSKIAVRAARTAADLAALYGAELVLLYVSLLPEETDDERRAAKSWLPELATVSVRRVSRDVLSSAAAVVGGVPYRTVVQTGRPEDTIVEFALNGQVDMLVMGGHGLGAVTGFLLGSVSQAVLENVKLPVVIVK